MHWPRVFLPRSRNFANNSRSRGWLSMFTLVRMKVEGFRGFREPQEFFFENPVTQLVGDNRTCKSSTLNAVEWGMFGDACCGQQTGIRERIGWVIPNQHMPTAKVCV